jgi:Tfp pilus assembly protein FimV
MDQTNNNSFKQQRSRHVDERAFFFKRLATGAADPNFSAKLKPLVDEYESEAEQAMLEIEQPATPQEAANSRVIPEDRTG